MNNLLINGRCRYLITARLWFITVLLISQTLGCAVMTAAPSDADSDSVIGRPPPADNDPFAVISLPADATPVAHQGVIEREDEPQSLNTKDEKIGAKTDVKPELFPDEITEKEFIPGQAACFSCVQICTTENTSPDCSDAPQDLICGWGTAPEPEQAKEVARAHCSSTLDMARSMPMYSHIEGNCPPASCR